MGILKHFLFIKPASQKVAVFVVNYNMPERTDKIYEYLIKNTTYPIDIFIIDNGSNLKKPSKYTNVFIKNNIQTTGGWLKGLEESDKKPYKYFAYMFIITSTKFTERSKDPITPLVKTLIKKRNAVGVHSALSKDSTTYWEHLKNRGTNKLRRTWFIDNIASMYRADWFNKIGRFDKNLIYAHGIDIEMGYLARKKGKSLWIDETIEVEKITDIGYKMKRMNMSADERRKLAWENTVEVLSKKYGPDWYNKLYNDHIKKEWR